MFENKNTKTKNNLNNFISEEVISLKKVISNENNETNINNIEKQKKNNKIEKNEEKDDLLEKTMLKFMRKNLSIEVNDSYDYYHKNIEGNEDSLEQIMLKNDMIYDRNAFAYLLQNNFGKLNQKLPYFSFSFLNKKYKQVIEKLLKLETNKENLDKLENFCIEELKLSRKNIVKISENSFSLNLFISFFYSIISTFVFSFIIQNSNLSKFNFLNTEEHFIFFFFGFILFYLYWTITSEDKEKRLLIQLSKNIQNNYKNLKIEEENKELKDLENKYI